MSTETDMRKHIIDEMYHLIAEYGYDKASMSKLCHAVGITKPSIYYYFPSKEAILLAVFDDIHIPTDDDAALLATATPEEFRTQLLKLGQDSISDFHDDIERHRVIAEIDLQTTRIPALAEHRTSVGKKTSASYEHILQHGVDIGALPSDFNIEAGAQFLYTLMSGMSQTVSNNETIDERAVWSWLVEKLLLP